MDQQLMTADEVASYLKLSQKHGRKTVISWVRQGKLKALRAGDLYRFRIEDITDFLESKS